MNIRQILLDHINTQLTKANRHNLKSKYYYAKLHKQITNTETILCVDELVGIGTVTRNKLLAVVNEFMEKNGNTMSIGKVESEIKLGCKKDALYYREKEEMNNLLNEDQNDSDIMKKVNGIENKIQREIFNGKITVLDKRNSKCYKKGVVFGRKIEIPFSRIDNSIVELKNESFVYDNIKYVDGCVNLNCNSIGNSLVDNVDGCVNLDCNSIGNSLVDNVGGCVNLDCNSIGNSLVDNVDGCVNLDCNSIGNSLVDNVGGCVNLDCNSIGNSLVDNVDGCVNLDCNSNEVNDEYIDKEQMDYNYKRNNLLNSSMESEVNNKNYRLKDIIFKGINKRKIENVVEKDYVVECKENEHERLDNNIGDKDILCDEAKKIKIKYILMDEDQFTKEQLLLDEKYIKTDFLYDAVVLKDDRSDIKESCLLIENTNDCVLDNRSDIKESCLLIENTNDCVLKEGQNVDFNSTAEGKENKNNNELKSNKKKVIVDISTEEDLNLLKSSNLDIKSKLFGKNKKKVDKKSKRKLNLENNNVVMENKLKIEWNEEIQDNPFLRDGVENIIDLNEYQVDLNKTENNAKIYIPGYGTGCYAILKVLFKENGLKLRQISHRSTKYTETEFDTTAWASIKKLQKEEYIHKEGKEFFLTEKGRKVAESLKGDKTDKMKNEKNEFGSGKCVLVDSREMKNRKTRSFFQSELKSLGLKVETRSISAGDFLFLKDGKVLCVAERKCGNDFVSSLIDGRLQEQCNRIKNTGIKNVFYFIEDLKKKHFANLNYFYGMRMLNELKRSVVVIETKSCKETAAAISIITDGLDEEDAMTYEEFMDIAEKGRNLNSNGILYRMLLSIRGVGHERAKKICGVVKNVDEFVCKLGTNFIKELLKEDSLIVRKIENMFIEYLE